MKVIPWKNFLLFNGRLGLLVQGVTSMAKITKTKSDILQDLKVVFETAARPGDYVVYLDHQLASVRYNAASLVKPREEFAKEIYALAGIEPPLQISNSVYRAWAEIFSQPIFNEFGYTEEVIKEIKMKTLVNGATACVEHGIEELKRDSHLNYSQAGYTYYFSNALAHVDEWRKLSGQWPTLADLIDPQLTLEVQQLSREKSVDADHYLGVKNPLPQLPKQSEFRRRLTVLGRELKSLLPSSRLVTSTRPNSTPPGTKP